MAVVALRPRGLGDFLTAVPAYRALQAAHPDHNVVVAAPRDLWPLAALAGVDLVGAARGEPLPVSLHRATLLVNMDDRGPESTRLALATHPQRLLAFEHPGVPETAGMPRWRRGEDETARWCRLLSDAGIPADPTDLQLPAPELDGPDFARGATLLHPSGPAERFAEIAAVELDAGREVVLAGGPAEVGAANEIARRVHLRPGAMTAGRTDLLRLAGLVANAGKVVCGDAGIAALARAFGTPVETVGASNGVLGLRNGLRALRPESVAPLRAQPDGT